MRRALPDLRLLRLGANQAVLCARLLGRLWHRKFMLSEKVLLAVLLLLEIINGSSRMLPMITSSDPRLLLR
uniref:Uncharacterized protein n=1 Tax=Arundo donax TaxID=35708 RepID=A0A0A9DA18_ARUDO